MKVLWVVPYVAIKGIIHITLFYFQIVSVQLKEKAIIITGWNLAYLKVSY